MDNPKICFICKKLIKTNRKTERNIRFFCSIKCWLNYLKQSKLKNRKIIKCSFCNKSILRRKYIIKKQNRNFCNRKCYNKFRNRITLKCFYCKRILKIIPYHFKRNKRHYCNRKCRDIGTRGINSWKWKGGKIKDNYPPNFNSQLRDKIRVRDNFKCQICGIPELECNRKLSIHHIDYNKKNCNESNLISLCVSCHIKTNTRKDLWKKKLINKSVAQ